MIECLSCKVKGVKKQYWGETHRTWGDRAADHVQALRDTNLDYGIVKHQVNDHPGQVPNFAYVAQKSWKTALERQVAESLLIDEAENESLLNSRSEWGQNAVPRIRIQREDGQNGHGQATSHDTHQGQNPGHSQASNSEQLESNPTKRRRKAEDNLRQLSLTTLVKDTNGQSSPLLAQDQPPLCSKTNTVKSKFGNLNEFMRKTQKRNRCALESSAIVMETASS